MQERIIDSGTINVKLGNVIYFILRPFFGFAFVIIMIFGLKAGLIIISGSALNVINERFLYVCASVSSVIGFSVGNVLDKFENFSNDKIAKVFEN